MVRFERQRLKSTEHVTAYGIGFLCLNTTRLCSSSLGASITIVQFQKREEGKKKPSFVSCRNCRKCSSTTLPTHRLVLQMKRRLNL